MTIQNFVSGEVLTAADLNNALAEAAALPMTQPNDWADAQTFNGTINQAPGAGANNEGPFLQMESNDADFVATPIILRVPTTASSTLTVNTTPISSYIYGQRTTTPASSAYTFPANTDTYITIEQGTGVMAYNSVANSGVLPTASTTPPTPPANSRTVLRISTAPIVSLSPKAASGLVMAGPGGSLAAGTYSVATVYHDATGYGALSTVDTVTVPASGLISFYLTARPVQCTGIDIYVSTAGGGTSTLGLVVSGVTTPGYIYDGSVAPGAAPPTGSTSMAIQKVSHALMPEKLTGDYFYLVPDGVTDNADNLEFAVNIDYFGIAYPIKIPFNTPSLHLGKGIYYISRHITCETTLAIYGEPLKTWIMGNSSNFISSSNAPAADTSYPTITDPGPMSGSCFYNIAHGGSMIIKDINFLEFKFCVALLAPVAGPIFERIHYQSCNAFHFAYLGSQLGIFKDVTGQGGSGPITIQGSTCYPSDSPYVNPFLETFFGAFTIQYESFTAGGGHANSTFDTWFQDSILRPTVLSYNNLTLAGATYDFSATSPACTPSGFTLFFVASRTGFQGSNATYSFIVHPTRVVFGGDYGFGMYNNMLSASSITGYSFEYETLVYPAGWSYFYCAGIGSLTVENVQLDSLIYPYLTLLGGANASTGGGTSAHGLNLVNSQISPVLFSDGSTAPLLPGMLNGRQSAVSYTINAPITNYTPESTYIKYAMNWANPDNANGLLATHNKVLDGYNNSFFLPVLGSTGNWVNQAQIYSTGSTFTYMLKVKVLNTATGEMDYGEFFVQSGASFSLTTAASVSNGDTTITTTANPTLPFGKYSQFSLGGTTVVAESFDNSTSVMTVEGVVTGLATSPLASGATLTYNGSIIETIIPFKRYFAEVLFNAAGVLIIESLLQTTTTLTTTDQQLAISFSMSNVEFRPAPYFSGAPTTPNWAKGAVVYESSPTPGGAIGYVCTTGGATPVWDAFGVIDDQSSTLAGTTAGAIDYTMPDQGTFKKFAAYANGYENDTTTDQTITFQTAFVNAPAITANTTGLTLSASTTALTITAPNATTLYSGVIVVEGL
jgi:hypothetical protein